MQAVSGKSSGAADLTAYKVLGVISFSHFLNDTIQSLMLAIYPLFKTHKA